jgi:hypothetical protein
VENLQVDANFPAKEVVHFTEYHLHVLRLDHLWYVHTDENMSVLAVCYSYSYSANLCNSLPVPANYLHAAKLPKLL